MKSLSFLRASFPLFLASVLAAACSSSTDAADPGLDDTGAAVDTGGTSGDAVADARSDSSGDATGDGSSSDSTAADSTATDSSSADSSATDSAASDTTASDTATADSASDSTSTTCSVDAVTGKSTGCSTSEYCDAPSCTTGTCKARPTATTDFAPACGCDHVTYWNATYAKSTGASVPSGGGGACGAGKKTCGGIASIKCPTGGACIGDRSGVASTCSGADFGGTCWAIPSGATCSGVIGFTSYRVCGGSPACQTYCSALLSGHDFYSDSSCPT